TTWRARCGESRTAGSAGGLWETHPRKLGRRAQGRPICHRPAQACDLDHSVPWQHGGHTNADDLVSFCRRDHRLKDEPGWTYQLAPDGTLTVTTPTGQTYDSTPPPLHEPRERTPLTDEPPPF
ncbi:HNH endonuclease signature motif containing protein, partial [Amycolatopsis sp. cmx-11-12]|uniref:HNH endonuclease signature motif containing protein n=1 Tax=Amycolatopsis sp. cmx-11-12 TaxID=2785795 RepID=UPI003917F2D5